MERPPVASTRAGAVKSPDWVVTRKPSGFSTAEMRWPQRRSTPTASASASSMATMARAEPSQKSWPSVFSWKAMPCLRTIPMKSCWV